MGYIHCMRALLIFFLLSLPMVICAQQVAPDFNSEQRYLPLFESKTLQLVHDGVSFRGIYLPENTGKPKGALLILYRHQGEPGWSDLRATLQDMLAERGWTSLAITLPLQAEHWQDSEIQLLSGRLQVAQQYLIDQGQMNIALLCYRDDCPPAAHYVARMSGSAGSKDLKPLQAWVMLDADNGGDDVDALPLLAPLQKPSLKVLDLISGPRYKAQQLQRRAAVKQKKWPSWRRIELPETPPGSASTAPRIASRICAWLDKTITGRTVTATIKH